MYPQPTNLSPSTSNPPKPTSTFQPSSTNKSTESSPQSSLPCGQRTPAASTSSSDALSSQTPPQTFVHPQHQPKIPTPTQHTSPSPHKQHIKTPVKTNANQPSQFSIVEEEQQCVLKSANGTQVKHSKQQLRQQDEHLCFHCNLPGHLKRSCPKIPYCSKCRTRGHAQDRCTNKSQRTRHMHQAGESRDQQKRNEDLPQFSSCHNKCLQCAGDHQTVNCTQQQQTPTTNSPASGTGTSLHQHAPNFSRTSVHANSQSPATHSQSTLHVQTPTLNINAPPFPPKLHQPPLPPHAQNRTNNYHNNQQQMHTPPTQPFNAQLPQSFNPHVPPPYFPQYLPANSPSAHSTDSSILLALQKQWERQERLDMERNQMEKQKEERKRMKEEREQRKEDKK